MLLIRLQFGGGILLCLIVIIGALENGGRLRPFYGKDGTGGGRGNHESFEARRESLIVSARWGGYRRP